MKTKAPKAPVRERVGTPHITRDKDGAAILNCPFCVPTHPLRPDVGSACGTMLQVRAVQRVYRAKYEKHMTCVKCGKGDGEMVLFQNGFIHTHDCNPGVVALAVPPKYSKLAKRVYGTRWQKLIEYIYGEIMPVHEVNPDGTKTGVTLGYSFKTKKRGKNGKHTPTQSG